MVFRWRVRLVLVAVLLLVMAATPLGGVIRAEQAHSPEEVVEEFFAAILDRDVERALSYATGVPYGEAAAFLHPDAIAGGWRLLAARPVARADHYGTWVRVTIGDDRAQTTAGSSSPTTAASGRWTPVRHGRAHRCPADVPSGQRSNCGPH